MGRINIFINNLYELIFVDCYSNEHILLKINDFLYNKSNIPFHTFNANLNFIFDHDSTLFGKCINNLQNVCNTYQFSSNEEVDYNLLLVFLTAIHQTHFSKPTNVALFGNTKIEILNLLSIIGEYNSKTEVVVIQNEIYDTTINNDYLNAISLVKTPPEISLCISSYEKTNLQNDNFDFVVVQGDILNCDISKKVTEIERVIKNNGRLIYILNNQEETEKILLEKYSDYKIYSISNEIKILLIDYKVEHTPELNFIEKYSILKSINNEIPTKVIRTMIKLLENDIQIAINNFDLKQKQFLIDLKEDLISFLCFKEDRLFYSEQIKDKLLSYNNL